MKTKLKLKLKDKLGTGQWYAEDETGRRFSGIDADWYTYDGVSDGVADGDVDNRNDHVCWLREKMAKHGFSVVSFEWTEWSKVGRKIEKVRLAQVMFIDDELVDLLKVIEEKS